MEELKASYEDFDAVLEVVGSSGRYQLFVAAVTALAYLPNAMAALAAVFEAATPTYWCANPALAHLSHEQQQRLVSPPGDQDYYDACRMYDVSNYSLTGLNMSTTDLPKRGAVSSVLNQTKTVECDEFAYDTSLYTSTIVTEWDLVCSQEWMKAFSTFLYMLGQLIGVLVFGHLADAIGRKKAWGVAIWTALVASTAAAFVPNYWAYCLLRLVVGACTLGGCTCTFTLGMEVTGKDNRLAASTLPHLAYRVGYMILSLFSYLVRDYAYLQVVLSVAMVPIIATYWILGESPRWLLKRGRYKEAEAELRRAARINGKTLPDNFSSGLENFMLQAPTGANKTYSLRDILRTPNMRCRTLNLWFIWFSTSMVYFGLSLGTGYLPGSPHVNIFLSGVMEVVSLGVTVITLERTGRKSLFVASFIVSGVACALMAAVPEGMTWLTISLLCVGKFGSSFSFVVVYIFTTEVYATVVRGIGLGAGSMAARIGSLTAPFIADMASVLWIPLPQAIFSSFSLAAALLSLLLPETLNRQLPETIAEGENFGRAKPSTGLCCGCATHEVADPNKEREVIEV